MSVAVPKLMVGLPLVGLVCGAIILTLIILVNTGHRRLVLFLLSLPFCLLLAIVAVRFIGWRYSMMADRRPSPAESVDWQLVSPPTHAHLAELERKEAEVRELRQKLKALEQPASGSPLTADADTETTEPTDMPSNDNGATATVVAADQPELDTGDVGQAPAAEATETMSVPGEDVTPEKPSSLSAAPSNRPDWVNQLPIREGKVHTQVATAGPFATLAECEESVADDIAKAVSNYNSWYLRQHPSDGRLIRVPQFDWSHAQRYSEVMEYGVGPMHNLYVLLEFDELYRREMDDCWKDTMVASRLTRVGLISGAVIALLTTLLVYLRLDASTEGRCSRRLQFAAAGTILALMASGVLIYRWVPLM